MVNTKIKTKHVWLFQQSFDTAEQALQLIKSEECWAVGKMYETIAGRKQPYRFNKAPKRGNQCARALQLLYHAEDLRVTLFVIDADHNHDEIVADIVKAGINKATKDVIDHLIEQKVLTTASIVDVPVAVPATVLYNSTLIVPVETLANLPATVPVAVPIAVPIAAPIAVSLVKQKPESESGTSVRRSERTKKARVV